MLGLIVTKRDGTPVTADEYTAAHTLANTHKEMRFGTFFHKDPVKDIEVEYHPLKKMAFVKSSGGWKLVEEIFDSTEFYLGLFEVAKQVKASGACFHVYNDAEENYMYILRRDGNNKLRVPRNEDGDKAHELVPLPGDGIFSFGRASDDLNTFCYLPSSSPSTTFPALSSVKLYTIKKIGEIWTPSYIGPPDIPDDKYRVTITSRGNAILVSRFASEGPSAVIEFYVYRPNVNGEWEEVIHYASSDGAGLFLGVTDNFAYVSEPISEEETKISVWRHSDLETTLIYTSTGTYSTTYVPLNAANYPYYAQPQLRDISMGVSTYTYSPSDLYTKTIYGEVSGTLTALETLYSSSIDGHTVAFLSNGNTIFALDRLGGSYGGLYFAWSKYTGEWVRTELLLDSTKLFNSGIVQASNNGKLIIFPSVTQSTGVWDAYIFDHIDGALSLVKTVSGTTNQFALMVNSIDGRFLKYGNVAVFLERFEDSPSVYSIYGSRVLSNGSGAWEELSPSMHQAIDVTECKDDGTLFVITYLNGDTGNRYICIYHYVDGEWKTQALLESVSYTLGAIRVVYTEAGNIAVMAISIGIPAHNIFNLYSFKATDSEGDPLNEWVESKSLDSYPDPSYYAVSAAFQTFKNDPSFVSVDAVVSPKMKTVVSKSGFENIASDLTAYSEFSFYTMNVTLNDQGYDLNKPKEILAWCLYGEELDQAKLFVMEI